MCHIDKTEEQSDSFRVYQIKKYFSNRGVPYQSVLDTGYEAV